MNPICFIRITLASYRGNSNSPYDLIPQTTIKHDDNERKWPSHFLVMFENPIIDFGTLLTGSSYHEVVNNIGVQFSVFNINAL